MAENAVTPAIPVPGVAIVASLSAAGTLYTAVAKRRLHITSLAITAQASALTAGICAITVVPENGTSGDPLRLAAAASGSAAVTSGPFDLPTVSNVVATVGAFTGTATFSLVGWEEPTEK